MSLLIRTGTALYHLGIRLSAPFIPKAKQWVDGRQGLWERLEEHAPSLQGCLWMHCASVGEFEQGRPVLEALKAERPDLPVLLTFFSPSGYDAYRATPLATHVEFLPPDSSANAERLLRLVHPRCAVFVRYEFWQRHLGSLRRQEIPTFLLSATFRAKQPFFRWFGAGHREMLHAFTHIFVQDGRSKELLQGIGIDRVTVSGDTRFDRVEQIVAEDATIPIAEAFQHASDGPVLIGGSTWPADEDILLKAMSELPNPPHMLIAPHELGQDQLKAIETRFPGPVVRWSKVEQHLTEPEASTRTLLVDRMGLLSRLYKYGDIAYVGGGFGDGIHNLLEAAAWGRPVVFGPDHRKFVEAQGLIDAGGGFAVKNAAELHQVLLVLTAERESLITASEAARRYVHDRTGATRAVVLRIREHL